MKIRRGLFDKHKQNMWIINIGVDKYIWIKKILEWKYILKKQNKNYNLREINKRR